MKRRKRGAYHKSINVTEEAEIKQFNENMIQRDGELKYQALYDYFRRCSTPEYSMGSNPRQINPEGEEC